MERYFELALPRSLAQMSQAREGLAAWLVSMAVSVLPRLGGVSNVTKIESILADAAAALAQAKEGDPHARLVAMTLFMRQFEELAKLGVGDSPEVRQWGALAADCLLAAEAALSDWEVEMGRVFYHGGEEDAWMALNRRSQHAVARDVFYGTAADALLAAHETPDVDTDFRDEAHRLALDGPRYYPQSHTWWRWPAE